MSSEQKKAIFLDRDGVLNRERGDFTWTLEDFQINDGVEQALAELSKKNFIFIVISNQSGIAKGLYSRQDADYLHLHLERVLGLKGIRIAEFYFCPHHPEKGNCICRKPDSQLLEKALARFGIDPSQSWFIGDADRDMEAAKKAGIKGLKVEPNSSLLNVLPMIIG